jgi:hypothetical protein
MRANATHNPPPPLDTAELTIAIGGLLAKLDNIERLLQAIATAPSHLATGANAHEQRLQNWPVQGQQRIIAPSRQRGGVIPITANTATSVINAEPGRAGLSIVNSGNNPVTLYLVGPGSQGPGAAQLYLAAGNSWDGRISDQPWAGSVSALSTLGTTLIWGAV